MTDRMESVKLRTFDISGTRLQRSCKVFTITCDTDEIANRVADQFLAAPPASPAGGESEAVAWRWRTLPKFRETGDDGEWEIIQTPPNFINPHHHEVEPLGVFAIPECILDKR